MTHRIIKTISFWGFLKKSYSVILNIKNTQTLTISHATIHFIPGQKYLYSMTGPAQKLKPKQITKGNVQHRQ